VISVVASNWEGIPVWVKLLGYFAVQGALGAGVVFACNRPGFVREVLVVLTSLFALAGIGLIAQIYNLHGDGWQAIALWLVLVLPLTLLAQRALAHQLWFLGLAAAVIIWVTSVHAEQLVVNRLLAAVAICFLVFAVGITRRLNLPERFSEAAWLWGLMFLLIAGASAADGLWAWRPLKAIVPYPGKYSLVFFLGSIAAALFSLFDRSDMVKPVRASLLALVIVIALFVGPLFYGAGGGHRILGCAGFLMVWSCAAAAAAFAKRRRLFNAASFVIALRFVGVYFQVFGSLMATGIGLIASGFVILATAYGWYRARLRVTQWVESRV
jgi:hypothetical protein